MNPNTHPLIAFIGGGNMASALLGGLLNQGHPARALLVVEPWDEQRQRLAVQFPGVSVLASADKTLEAAELVVWAVKPQSFREAATQVRPFLGNCLHLSVAAGITTDSMVDWLGRSRMVRAMPNTPALVGLGMTGLYARPGVSEAERAQVSALIQGTGDAVWVDDEAQLDAVTALSGSGPAYVFYFLEAMRDAGSQMGLSPEVAQQLAVSTFIGAATLAQRSSEPLHTLRERVTSKGGTTYAALTSLQEDGVKARFEAALFAAQRRAEALGREFGK
ncbi:MAG: Pyrroline-5-carboxylate reductase [Pseudomonadota bacterium]|jgi:pyrroline-5-carboxylate reductase